MFIGVRYSAHICNWVKDFNDNAINVDSNRKIIRNSCISNAVFANIEVIKETKYFGVFIFTSTENDNPISLSYKFYRVDIKMWGVIKTYISLTTCFVINRPHMIDKSQFYQSV